MCVWKKQSNPILPPMRSRSFSLVVWPTRWTSAWKKCHVLGGKGGTSHVLCCAPRQTLNLHAFVSLTPSALWLGEGHSCMGRRGHRSKRPIPMPALHAHTATTSAGATSCGARRRPPHQHWKAGDAALWPFATTSAAGASTKLTRAWRLLPDLPPHHTTTSSHATPPTPRQQRNKNKEEDKQPRQFPASASLNPAWPSQEHVSCQ